MDGQHGHVGVGGQHADHGTGSAVPIGTPGRQRASLLPISRTPAANPYRLIAVAPYALQVGVNRHRAAVRGEIHRR